MSAFSVETIEMLQDGRIYSKYLHYFDIYYVLFSMAKLVYWRKIVDVVKATT